MAGDWESKATIGQQVSGALPAELVTVIQVSRGRTPGERRCDACGRLFTRSNVTGNDQHFVLAHTYQNDGDWYECLYPRNVAWTFSAVR